MLYLDENVIVCCYLEITLCYVICLLVFCYFSSSTYSCLFQEQLLFVGGTLGSFIYPVQCEFLLHVVSPSCIWG
jgi:hypothetical protein